MRYISGICCNVTSSGRRRMTAQQVYLFSLWLCGTSMKFVGILDQLLLLQIVGEPTHVCVPVAATAVLCLQALAAHPHLYVLPLCILAFDKVPPFVPQHRDAGSSIKLAPLPHPWGLALAAVSSLPGCIGLLHPCPLATAAAAANYIQVLSLKVGTVSCRAAPSHLSLAHA